LIFAGLKIGEILIRNTSAEFRRDDMTVENANQEAEIPKG